MALYFTHRNGPILGAKTELLNLQCCYVLVGTANKTGVFVISEFYPIYFTIITGLKNMVRQLYIPGFRYIGVPRFIGFPLYHGQALDKTVIKTGECNYYLRLFRFSRKQVVNILKTCL